MIENILLIEGLIAVGTFLSNRPTSCIKKGLNGTHEATSSLSERHFDFRNGEAKKWASFSRLCIFDLAEGIRKTACKYHIGMITTPAEVDTELEVGYVGFQRSKRPNTLTIIVELKLWRSPL